MSRWLALAANLVLLGLLGFFGWLHSAHPTVLYAAAQEDRALEWMSFWSFLLAGGFFMVAARCQRRNAGRLPWFLFGLALFCMFVAMEEISWGQRVFGHRPPDYFLAENFQQETNVHNIASTDVRLWTFRAIILGYGVLLPLLSLIPAGRRLLDRLGVAPPPFELMPSMFALFWVHLQYPWKFTGEIIELGLGIAFLLAALTNTAALGDPSRRARLAPAVGAGALVAALGFASAAWSQNRESSDPAMLQRAESETRALRNDLVALAEARGVTAITKCNLHRRVYTFVERNNRARRLATGSFAGLVDSGMPEARAEFFLDPWNSPYWIRDRCDKESGRRVIFIYSFGPNRSRDSSRWEIRGDDIGEYVLLRPSR